MAVETKKEMSSTSFPPSINIPRDNGLAISVIATVTHPVSIIGKKGFQPEEAEISAGDSVTWSNDDPQRKSVVLTFERQGEGGNRFQTSPLILPGKELTMVFSLPGMYEYWTTGYGVTGKLIVKENGPPRTLKSTSK